MTLQQNATTSVLPLDASRAALAGRVWRPDQGGPAVVAVRDGAVVDISRQFATMRDLCETADPAAALRAAAGQTLGSLDALLANTPIETRDPTRPWLLAPNDLQAIKAAGVTFAISMLERVIEERARGDLNAAAAIRAEVTKARGASIWKSASVPTRKSSPRPSPWPPSAACRTPACTRNPPGTIRNRKSS